MNVLERELDPLVVGYLNSANTHASDVQAPVLRERQEQDKEVVFKKIIIIIIGLRVEGWQRGEWVPCECERIWGRRERW